jgi:hypothetical protein
MSDQERRILVPDRVGPEFGRHPAGVPDCNPGGRAGFYAKIVEDGTYSDERYKFASVRCMNAAGGAAAQMTMAAPSAAFTGTATNLAEIGSHAHELDDGRIVWITSMPDIQTPAICHYEFEAWPEEEFMAFATAAVAVAGATGDATNPATQWTYTIAEIVKISGGYSTASLSVWAMKSAGRTGAAYNDFEDGNAAGFADHSIKLGIGLSLNELGYSGSPPYKFYLIPVMLNILPIRVRTQTYVVSGTPHTEYRFAVPNELDGGCTS